MPRTERPRFLANTDFDGAVENVVDFVRAFVCMPGLCLVWLEAIHVAKHPFGIKNINFLHFVGREGYESTHILKYIHTNTPVRSSVLVSLCILHLA